MREWKEYKLGEFFKVKHGFAFSGKYISEEKSQNILVTPGNFRIGGGFKSDKFKYYQSDNFPNEYILKEGDIVVTMTDLSKDSDSLGYSAKIPNSINGTYLHNQRIGLLQFKVEQKVSKYFIYWLLRTREYQGYIVGSASGTSIMHTSPSRIEAYECLLPPLPEQKAIASVLSSLDDKIDLLHRQNATLEKTAETLFRQWFVEEAKEEWEEITLSKLIDIHGGFSYKGEFIGDGDSILLGMGCVSFEKRFLNSGARAYAGDCPDKFIVQPRDIVIATRQQSDNLPILGFPSIIPNEYKNKKVIAGANLYKLINNSHLSNYLIYTLLRSKEYREHISSCSKGSTVRMITKDAIESFPLLVPPQNILDELEKILDDIDKKQMNILDQIRTLTQLRDTLLPKLMSGEARVIM